MHRSILLLGILLVSCTTIATNENQRSRMAFSKAGDGEVIVIFEAGLGNGMNSWAPVIEPISAFATTFAYDRPGYGQSREATGRLRTGRDSVENLRALLANQDLPPPYVLVGHSLGGLYMQLFARLHPDEVAGIVLIDSTSAGTRAVPRPVGLLPVLQREYDGIAETVKQVLDAPPFPEIPLFVLTAGKTNASQRIADLHLENQNRLAKLSPISEHKISANSGHFVHYDDPRLVIDAVHYVVEQVQANN
jgi:pimeloyl-ACP methyl ester carboxylesterase